MKKAIFAAMAALTITAAGGNASPAYPAAIVIIDALHTPDFYGYMDCITFSDWQRGDYSHKIRIDADPEDLSAGDVLAVIMDGGAVKKYRYIGYIY